MNSKTHSLPEKPALEARFHFAKQLRATRLSRGYVRARYFAQAIGIEENRYTRYERAEVEPPLSVIRKICAVLDVSPNELLGHDGCASPSTIVDGLAWRLASEIADLANRDDPSLAANGLRALHETNELFQELRADPFSVAARITNNGALGKMAPGRQEVIAGMMQDYLGSISARQR